MRHRLLGPAGGPIVKIRLPLSLESLLLFGSLRWDGGGGGAAIGQCSSLGSHQSLWTTTDRLP